MPENPDAAHHLTLNVSDRRSAVVDRSLRAILRDQQRVVRQPHDRPLPQGTVGGVIDRLAGLFIDDSENSRQGPADDLGLGPCEGQARQTLPARETNGVVPSLPAPTRFPLPKMSSIRLHPP
jgi:hypothetical protein